MKRWILVLAAALPIAVMAQIQQRTLRPTVEVFPFEYNSAADDFCPAVTHNGATLYFTSDRSGEQRIYVCRSRGGQWRSPDRIRTLGDAKQIGCPTLTPDGQTMIFAAYQHEAGSNGRTDLYMSKRSEGYWGKGTNLGATVNSSAWGLARLAFQRWAHALLCQRPPWRKRWDRSLPLSLARRPLVRAGAARRTQHRIRRNHSLDCARRQNTLLCQ